MKAIFKSGLVLVSLLSFGAVHADVVNTGKTLERSVRFMFPKFSSESQPRLYTKYFDEESRRTDFTIYDENFSELKSFSTPSYQEITTEYRISHVMYGPVGVFVQQSNEDLWMENISKEEFSEICASEGATKQYESDGELICLRVDSPWDYFNFEIYGYKYPNIVFVWRDGSAYRRYILYEAESWGPTGIFTDWETETSSACPEPITLYPYDSSCTDLDGVRLSQNLFNEDAEYEWVIPVFEAIDCSYANEEEKVEGQRLRVTGFQVISEKGTTVTEFKMPSGFYCYDNSLDVYLMNDKNFLLIDVFNDDLEEYTAIFEIQPKSGSVKMVGSPLKVSVNPSLVNRGTRVNIDLSSPAAENCKVTVTSVNGKNIIVRSIEPGSMGTSIDTANFEKGVYIVSVSDGKTTKEHTKIIIR